MHKIKKTAPIAFFAYNRPEHTRKSLESLAANHGAESSELFVFCDGPKSTSDAPLVKEVRRIAGSRQWCGKVHIIERKYNMGLANSVIAGVTEVCEMFGCVIVLEDDLVTSPYFLNYMNKALELFEKNTRVFQISAYMYPLDLKCSEEAFFLPFTTSWGWATWHRAWRNFDPEVKHYPELASEPQRIYEFNLNGSYPYFKMLKNQIHGQLDSWAIRWYFSVFNMNGLVLHPKWSLVRNIGFDGSGTNCGNSEDNGQRLQMKDIFLSVPASVTICKESFQDIQEYLTSRYRSDDVFPANVRTRIKKFLFGKL